jgi:integrase/recombinase XerD
MSGPGVRIQMSGVAGRSGLDSDHEVPPRGLLPDRYRRVRPYIYSEAEVIAIVEHARTPPSIYGMRGLTCSMLFGLHAGDR